MMRSIILAAFILATTPLCAVPPLGTTLQNAPSDLPGPWIPGKSRIRDYKTLSDQLKEKLKADLQTIYINPIDVAKKYHLSEEALRPLRKKYGARAHYTYLRQKQITPLIQRYGRDKEWLQHRTNQEGAFDLGLSMNQFKRIKKLYQEQQQKAAQMPSRTHAQKTHQPAKPQAKAAHTDAHMKPDNALPKDLEQVQWKKFLPLYDPKAHIPLPPNLRRPALVESQQRGVKRPHDTGTHMQPKQPTPPKRRRLNP